MLPPLLPPELPELVVEVPFDEVVVGVEVVVAIWGVGTRDILEKKLQVIVVGKLMNRPTVSNKHMTGTKTYVV